MTHGRLCIECAKIVLIENVDGLHYKNDAAVLHRWRLGMARSVGALLLDELDHTP